MYRTSALVDRWASRRRLEHSERLLSRPGGSSGTD
jgi:hypothetical protein